MKSTLLSAGLFGLQAAAFPQVLEMVSSADSALELDKRATSPSAAQAISKGRQNCGLAPPCLTFDAKEQLVSTTGDNAWQSPSASQIRGPCPGLNAAANHGYLSRSGVTTIVETITGLGALYGMSPDLAGFLAAYAVIFDGDPVAGTWSIGGPSPTDPLTAGLLGGAQGISYSHNVYEGDASISRYDAYMNKGNAQQLNLDRYRSAFAAGMAQNSYTMDLFAQNFNRKTTWSIEHNPYYFAPLFSTTLVSPAAYNFVIAFMSNHSAATPGGYLDGSVLNEFFAISGKYPNFKWTPGYERVPNNWYRRPSVSQYNAESVFNDLIVEWLAYPGTFRFGGNTNGVNTFAGVSLDDFTGGAYNLSSLLTMNDPSNALCFFSQAISEAIPDIADSATNTAVAGLVGKYITSIVPSSKKCPAPKYANTLLQKYPGRTYSPSGPANEGGPEAGDDKAECCDGINLATN